MNYVIDDNNNKQEAFSKEEVLAVLNQAIKDGTLNNIVADAAFVSKLKCCVSGMTNKVAFVTQAKYNEIAAAGQIVENCLYYITDDTTLDNIDVILQDLSERINNLGKQVESNRITAENNYMLLQKNITSYLTPNVNGIGIKLRHSGLYAIHYGSSETDLLDENILFSYDITSKRISKPVGTGDLLELVYQADGQEDGLYTIMPKSGTTRRILYGYLITKY